MEQIREKAAAWLEYIMAEIEKRLQDPHNGFNMRKYVTVFDKEKNCGTICCIEGWLVSIYPDLLYHKPCFDDDPSCPNYTVMIRPSNTYYNPKGFAPYRIGIPIRGTLWRYITLPGMYVNCKLISKYGCIFHDISFEGIKTKILRIAEDIRKAELDDYLFKD